MLVDGRLVRRIVDSLQQINDRIAEETRTLGPGFRIGHSYFCGRVDGRACDEAWFGRIVEYEIAPLLREYWFDDLKRADEEIARLRG